MKAIIITDAEAKALLDKLELENLRAKRPGLDTEEYERVHRIFHYEVCKWLQEMGADLKRYGG